MSYADWSGTTADNYTVLGIDIGPGCDAKSINDAMWRMMADLADADLQGFPAGTRMPFNQTAAPTGWTKITTSDDCAMRVVSGTASTGGSVAFTTAFSATRALVGTSGSHVLTEAEIPAHSHNNGVADGISTVFTYGSVSVGAGSATENISSNSSAGTLNGLTSETGGDGGHTHTLTSGSVNLAVKYVDFVIASKA